MDLTSPGAVIALRMKLEAELGRSLEGAVDSFVSKVIEDAAEALESPVLVAAGRRVPDPFAFTNVMKRWYAAVRHLADADSTPDEVYRLLESSGLPTKVYEDVVEVLRTAREETWTAYRTKRHLSKLLIPKESSGRWSDRAAYRAAIRRMARTMSTRNAGAMMSRELADAGFTHKRWVSRMDPNVRPTHAVSNGQTVPLGQKFQVGAYSMRYPGDALAPLEETANCRCVIVGVAREDEDMSTTTLTAAAVEAEDEPQALLWHGIIGMEQTMTGDGRMIEDGALNWQTPIPLRYVTSDVGGHDGAEVVGTIQYVERQEGGKIYAAGTFDGDSEAGREAARVVGGNITNGVSMDLDDVSFEVRVAEDVLNAMEAQMDGAESGDDESDDEAEARAVVDGKVVMMTVASDDEVHVTKSARIRAATIVAIPAFAEAQIETLSEDGDEVVSDEEAIAAIAEDDELSDEEVEEFNWVDEVGGLPKYIREIADSLMKRGYSESRAIATAVNTVKRWARGGPARQGGEGSVSAKTQAKAIAALAEWEAKKARAKAASAGTSELSLVAGGGPELPPADWFENPRLTEPTAIVVQKDGRVFGHLATWDSCHIAHPDFCTSPPRSASGYAYFHTGSVLCEGGQEVGVGHLTLNTTHAKQSAKAMATIAHYENTGLAAADVRAGEDEWGIWVAGAVRPGLSEKKMRALRAAPLSGDWRRIQGNLELVAALAVNVPGFPIPRPQGLTAGGHTVSLVASGMVPPRKVKAPGTEGALSTDDLRYLKGLAQRERKNYAASLAARARAGKVHAFAEKMKRESD